MEPKTSRETINYSDIQEFSNVLSNPELYYRFN
jgi:hypothetical protein